MLKLKNPTYQLLAVYRGFALILAAVQIILIAPPPTTLVTVYVVLGVLGLYSLIRVLLPNYQHYREVYVGLGTDALVCTLPLFLTGGLASPFLLYSLSPIIYAALIFPKPAAFSCAGFISLSLIGSLFFLKTFQPNFGFIGIYIIASFLIAIMPYTANLNIYRRLEQEAALKERKKLARELHDTVAQTLVYVNLKANLITDTLAKGNLDRSVKELSEMKESLDSTYDEVRRTIDSLGHPNQQTIDFIPALSLKVKEFSHDSQIQSRLLQTKDKPKLSPQIANELLYIVGEAMTNVRHHAQATNMEVGIHQNSNGLEIMIKDNGHGFDLETCYQNQESQNHHGLIIMQERAESLGGKVDITSTPNNGTDVKITIPTE
ncbi:sensor histidine kinase [Chloroflexota bacterium]